MPLLNSAALDVGKNLISGVGNHLINQLFGTDAKSIAKYQYQLNKQMYDYQFDKETSYNSPSNQVELLKAANVNPTQYLGGFSGSDSGTATMNGVDYSSAINASTNASNSRINNMLNLAMMQSQIANSREDARGKKIANDVAEVKASGELGYLRGTDMSRAEWIQEHRSDVGLRFTDDGTPYLVNTDGTLKELPVFPTNNYTIAKYQAAGIKSQSDLTQSEYVRNVISNDIQESFGKKLSEAQIKELSSRIALMASQANLSDSQAALNKIARDIQVEVKEKYGILGNDTMSQFASSIVGVLSRIFDAIQSYFKF